MIKIRSTQKLAKSEHNGLCDISRNFKVFTINILKGTFSVGLHDQLFQEKEVTKDIIEQQEDPENNRKYIDVVIGTEDIIERKVVDDKGLRHFTYPLALLDGVYEIVGSDIVKGANGFSEQFMANALPIIMAQTISANPDGSGWHGMTEWEQDTTHKLVNSFSE